ncbi:hypothetical protein GCM10010524_14580 [Streptomyces mexicanus]
MAIRPYERARSAALWETLGGPGVGFAPGDRHTDMGHTDMAAAPDSKTPPAAPVRSLTEGLTYT